MSDKGWKKKGSRIRAARLRRARLHVFGVRAANGSDCWKRGCSTGTKGAFPKFKFSTAYARGASGPHGGAARTSAAVLRAASEADGGGGAFKS